MVLAGSGGYTTPIHTSGASDWARATRAPPGLNPIQGKRLLYVDDDPLLRRFATRLLARAGATCCPVGTHDDAVEILCRTPRLDLAILDVHMPDGDVAQLVPRLWAVRPGLCLIGTSKCRPRPGFRRVRRGAIHRKALEPGGAAPSCELVTGEPTPRWIEIPLGPDRGRRVPTWGALAERYDRCRGRVAFYVRQRVQDHGAFERIVTEALESNVELLVAEHDELEEIRRLQATAGRLIAMSVGSCPGSGVPGP